MGAPPREQFDLGAHVREVRDFPRKGIGFKDITPLLLDPDALNAHTLAWADAVNASGAALVTPSLLDGTWSVRVSIGAEPTERHDVEELWRLLRQAAETR